MYKLENKNSEFKIETKLFIQLKIAEAALHRCSHEKVFWKYAGKLQENTHAEVWFQ